VASDTRQRLIESATQRFYRDGFRNVGLEQILDDVGISRTAFYKHFASKDDLMLEVLEALNEWIQSVFRDMIRERGGCSPAGQLRALFDVVERVIEPEDFHGCIFVNAAMEFPLPHDPRARTLELRRDNLHSDAGRLCRRELRSHEFRHSARLGGNARRNRACAPARSGGE